jgi:hypothetical protein
VDTIVTVDARISAAGDIYVRSFVWDGRELAVTSNGRQWTEPVGEALRRCVLVMAPSYGAFQLCLGPDGLWRARPLSRPTHLA